MAERLNNEEARQGQRGKPVLWVLLGSLALLVLATIGLLTWNGANSPKDYASQSQDSARQEVTGSVNGKSNAPSSANSGGTPAANPAYPEKSQPTANPNAPK